MARDFLPIFYPEQGPRFRGNVESFSLQNCMPWVLPNGEVGACPRYQLDSDGNAPSASTDRGRGVFSFDSYAPLYLDESTYFYSGGSQDLTATSAPGYAGNTGFNEEYIATIVPHLVSGVQNLVIVNAGHTSTNASANHGNIWYISDATSAPASVSDADMPGNNGVSIIRGGASLDGYFFLCDIKGQIHNSNLNDITAWTATDFITAEREPDIGVYLGKQGDNLVYIGTRSIEFFYNAGNASGSPLARRQDVSYKVGCIYPNTVVESGDVIYFAGTDHSGYSRIYALANFELTAISHALIDELISTGLSIPSELSASVDTLEHQVFMSDVIVGDSPGLVFTSPFNSFHYHIPTGKWSRWKYDATVTYEGGLTAQWNNSLPIVSFNRGVISSGSNRVMQMTDGRLVSWATKDNDAIADFGTANAPDVHMMFPMWDAGTDKKKRVNWVRVVTEPVATDSVVNSDLNIYLRWLDLDRESPIATAFPANYTSTRTIDVNLRGARVARCGTTRLRRFALQWPVGHGPVSIVKGLEIEYEVVE